MKNTWMMPKIWVGQRQTEMNTIFCRFFQAPYFFVGILSPLVAFLSLWFHEQIIIPEKDVIEWPTASLFFFDGGEIQVDKRPC